MNYYFESE